MSEKLRATRKQLCREEEEKTSLQTLLKQREQEDLKFHELLGKKNKEVCLMQQQNQQVTRACVFVVTEANNKGKDSLHSLVVYSHITINMP